jgi:cytochrome c-type biogenesis protein CcmH/NrfG
MAARVDREFVERSLEDLEREHDAGDLSDRDYRELRDKYERRLRGEEPPPRPPAKPAYVVAAVSFLVLVAVAAGVLVAQSLGRREDGGGAVAADPTESPSSPATTLPEDLTRCVELEGGDAIDCFTAYTDAHPDDAAGFTQFAIFAIQAGMANDSQQLFALELDPGAVDARVYLAVLLDRTGRAEDAAVECERLADVEVPPDLGPLVNLACSGGATTGP